MGNRLPIEHNADKLFKHVWRWLEACSLTPASSAVDGAELSLVFLNFVAPERSWDDR